MRPIDKLLFTAAKSGSLDEFNLALAAGADLRARDDSQNTPLHIAANYSRVNIIDSIMSSPIGIKTIIATNIHGRTPLQFIAPYAGERTVKALLSKREGIAAINHIDNSGKTAKDLFIGGYQSSMDVLNDNGAMYYEDIERQYRKTWTGFFHRILTESTYESLCKDPLMSCIVLSTSCAIVLALCVYENPEDAKTIIGDELVESMLNTMEKVVGLVR